MMLLTDIGVDTEHSVTKSSVSMEWNGRDMEDACLCKLFSYICLYSCSSMEAQFVHSNLFTECAAWNLQAVSCIPLTVSPYWSL